MHVCHEVIQKFPDVMMASSFYPVPNHFSGVRGDLPVFTATRKGNLPVPIHGNGVS